MALASVGVRTSNLTINQSSAELRTAAGAKCRVLEVSLIQVTGTAQTLCLGRPAAVGITPGTTSLFQRDDSADPACVTSMNLTWGTSPTLPTIMHRRWNSAATIGVGIVWTFPRGIVVPISASLAIGNVTTALACDLNMVIDE